MKMPSRHGGESAGEQENDHPGGDQANAANQLKNSGDGDSLKFTQPTAVGSNVIDGVHWEHHTKEKAHPDVEGFPKGSLKNGGELFLPSQQEAANGQEQS